MVSFNAKAIFFVAVLSFTACQKNANNTNYVRSNESSKILGGTVVQANDLVALSTVALKYVEKNGQAYPMCTGTLISPDLVLTASHCLQNITTKELKIGFSLDVKTQFDPTTMYEVSGFIVNPDYAANGSHDVALIALAKAAPANYHPVEILSASYQLQVGMPMLLAGYGVINDMNGADTEALRKVTVPMAKVLETIVVTDQTKNSGACNGDSGGPAYLEQNGKLYVYGITRGPHETATDCHHFGEYTYASKFEQFIMQSAMSLKAQAPSFVVPK